MLTKLKEMRYLCRLLFIALMVIFPYKSFYGEAYTVKSSSGREHKYRLERLKEKHKELMIEAIIYHESRFRTYAYKEDENAAGVLQIRPIMVREANKIVGYEKYTLDDRWDREKSIELFWDVQNYHNPKMILEDVCHYWNSGQAGRKNWKATEMYRQDVSLIYNRLLASEV